MILGGVLDMVHQNWNQPRLHSILLLPLYPHLHPAVT